ncbi:MAG: cytochrome b/b6 domain-containing protein [Salinivirgaceae bacterium]|nr:cytochrome b/b6 domain-containing protein [Salinivirgaceae bacterium]
MENHKLYLYPIWLRIWHGINALCIILLIITGLSMQYGNIDYPLISFKTSVMIHNFCGIVASIGFVIFLVGNFISDNGIHYRFKIRGLYKRLFTQLMYYVFGYFKGEPKPFPITKENKFNPLQRISYAVAMYVLVPLVVITGLGLLYPELIFERFLGMSGVQITAVMHSIGGFFVSFFLMIHLYVASIGKNPLKNYKSILTGYHES